MFTLFLGFGIHAVHIGKNVNAVSVSFIKSSSPSCHDAKKYF